MNDPGFVDLRLNQQEGLNEESFWPSFTDVMTVIVMIFLLAMVILLIRNMELVKQLRATMEAERHAAELARATGKEKESLAARLHSAESELSELRMQLMRMEEQREQQETAIASQTRQIRELSQLNEDLKLENEQLQQRNEELGDRLASAERETDTLRTDLEQVRIRHKETLDELEALRRTQQAQQQQLEETRARLTASDTALANLRSEYTTLKGKYDRLVRPARSASGKFVVEVRYAKVNGKPRIDFRTANESTFRQVSLKELHQRLQGLKKKYPNDLYVKVVIPKNSGLTYNEAYSFTTELHRKYDYYYQEPLPTPAPAP